MTKKSDSQTTKLINKNKLLQGVLKRELIEIPETGASIWLRQLSAEDVVSFKKLIDDMKSEGTKETTAEQDVQIMTFLISSSACDEKGELLFTKEEASSLAKNDYSTLLFLGTKVLEVSKLGIGVNGFVSEAKKTLPNDQKMSLSENSQES